MEDAWRTRLSEWEYAEGRQGRREKGAIWTPPELAGWMADWLLEISPASVLDPAAGGGNLLAPFAERSALNACEREVALRDVLRARFDGLEAGPDAFALTDGPRFDAITTNPPYISHAAITGKDALHQRVAELTGFRLPRTSNLAVLFIALCIGHLRPGGRMAALVPTEVLQVRSGQAARQMLLEAGLRLVVDLDDDGLFGAGVTSTACLLMIERGYEGPVTFCEQAGRPPFPSWSECEAGGRRLGRAEIDPAARWRPRSQRMELRGRSRSKGTERPLGEIVDVKPGIITGQNALFLTSYPEAIEQGIAGHLRYCLIRPHQLACPAAHGDDEVERIKASGARRWLIALPDDPDPAAADWLARAGAAGADQVPTARARNPWWSQEMASQTDIAISNFRRSDYLVSARWDEGVVRNDWAIVPNRLTLPSERSADATCLYGLLVSTRGQASLREHERHAGSGLFTLRSGALKGVSIPDPALLSTDWRGEMEDAVRRWVATLRRGSAEEAELARELISSLADRA